MMIALIREGGRFVGTILSSGRDWGETIELCPDDSRKTFKINE